MIKLFRYVYRSAVTGQYVSAETAMESPETTVRERVWFWQRMPTQT